MSAQTGLLLLVGGIVLVAILAMVVRQSYETTLRKVGEPLGLSYDRMTAMGVGIGHQVRGRLDGRAFELAVAPLSSGSGQLCERWTIKLCGTLPTGFAAGKNAWGRRASSGLSRVTTGDPEFDKRVLVEGRYADEAYAVLEAPARRQALRDLASMNAIVHDNKVLFSKDSFDNNAATLQVRLERLRRIAQAIDPISPVRA